MENKVSRSRVLLAMQRVFIGEICSKIRGISVCWDNTKVKILVIHSEYMNEDRLEDFNCLETEMLSHFPEQEVSIKCLRIDPPQVPLLPEGNEWFFLEKEALK